jgi:hypothetical protein
LHRVNSVRRPAMYFAFNVDKATFSVDFTALIQQGLLVWKDWYKWVP